MLARQINLGRVQEFSRSYEPTSWVFDAWFEGNYRQRLKANILSGEIDPFVEYVRNKSYQQPPLVNAMYDAEQRMQEIIEAPQLTAVDKSKLYSDQLNRFLMFTKRWVSWIIIPVTKPLFKRHHYCPMNQLRQYHLFLLLQNIISEEERPKLKRNFFQIGTKVTWHEWAPKQEKCMNVLYWATDQNIFLRNPSK